MDPTEEMSFRAVESLLLVDTIQITLLETFPGSASHSCRPLLTTTFGPCQCSSWSSLGLTQKHTILEHQPTPSLTQVLPILENLILDLMPLSIGCTFNVLDTTSFNSIFLGTNRPFTLTKVGSSYRTSCNYRNNGPNITFTLANTPFVLTGIHIDSEFC